LKFASSIGGPKLMRNDKAGAAVLARPVKLSAGLYSPPTIQSVGSRGERGV
jgi:hypothetical protein